MPRPGRYLAAVLFTTAALLLRASAALVGCGSDCAGNNGESCNVMVNGDMELIGCHAPDMAYFFMTAHDEESAHSITVRDSAVMLVVVLCPDDQCRDDGAALAQAPHLLVERTNLTFVAGFGYAGVGGKFRDGTLTVRGCRFQSPFFLTDFVESTLFNFSITVSDAVHVSAYSAVQLSQSVCQNCHIAVRGYSGHLDRSVVGVRDSVLNVSTVSIEAPGDGVHSRGVASETLALSAFDCNSSTIIASAVTFRFTSLLLLRERNVPVPTVALIFADAASSVVQSNFTVELSNISLQGGADATGLLMALGDVDTVTLHLAHSAMEIRPSSAASGGSAQLTGLLGASARSVLIRVMNSTVVAHRSTGASGGSISGVRTAESSNVQGLVLEATGASFVSIVDSHVVDGSSHAVLLDLRGLADAVAIRVSEGSTVRADDGFRLGSTPVTRATVAVDEGATWISDRGAIVTATDCSTTRTHSEVAVLIGGASTVEARRALISCAASDGGGDGAQTRLVNVALEIGGNSSVVCNGLIEGVVLEPPTSLHLQEATVLPSESPDPALGEKTLLRAIAQVATSFIELTLLNVSLSDAFGSLIVETGPLPLDTSQINVTIHCLMHGGTDVGAHAPVESLPLLQAIALPALHVTPCVRALALTPTRTASTSVMRPSRLESTRSATVSPTPPNETTTPPSSTTPPTTMAPPTPPPTTPTDAPDHTEPPTGIPPARPEQTRTRTPTLTGSAPLGPAPPSLQMRTPTPTSSTSLGTLSHSTTRTNSASMTPPAPANATTPNSIPETGVPAELTEPPATTAAAAPTAIPTIAPPTPTPLPAEGCAPVLETLTNPSPLRARDIHRGNASSETAALVFIRSMRLHRFDPALRVRDMRVASSSGTGVSSFQREVWSQVEARAGLLPAGAIMDIDGVSHTALALSLPRAPRYFISQQDRVQLTIPLHFFILPAECRPALEASGGEEAVAVFTVVPSQQFEAVEAVAAVADASVGVAVSLALVSGGGAATSDAQQIAMIANMPCASADTQRAGGRMSWMLSPFFGLGAELVVLGNMALSCGLFLVHFVMTKALFLVKRKKLRSSIAAEAAMRFPALSIIVCFFFLQGTLTAAVFLMSNSSNNAQPLFVTGGPPMPLTPTRNMRAAIGALGVLYAVLVCVCFLIVSLRFVRTDKAVRCLPYALVTGRLPAVVRLVLPMGLWLPEESARRFSPCFKSFKPQYVVLSCLDPVAVVVTTVIAMTDVGLTEWGCTIQFALLAAIYGVRGIMFLGLRPLRIGIMNIFAGCSSLVFAGVMACSGAQFGLDAEGAGVAVRTKATLLLSQFGLMISSQLVKIAMLVLERRKLKKELLSLVSSDDDDKEAKKANEQSGASGEATWERRTPILRTPAPRSHDDGWPPSPALPPPLSLSRDSDHHHHHHRRQRLGRRLPSSPHRDVFYDQLGYLDPLVGSGSRSDSAREMEPPPPQRWLPHAMMHSARNRSRSHSRSGGHRPRLDSDSRADGSSSGSDDAQADLPGGGGPLLAYTPSRGWRSASPRHEVDEAYRRHRRHPRNGEHFSGPRGQRRGHARKAPKEIHFGAFIDSFM